MSEPMHLLFITNVFPNRYQPTKGVFNLDMARALARDHEVCVVSPVSWVDEWRAWRTGGPAPGRDRCADLNGIEVHYPRYYYPPKVLREHYGRFLWSSTRGTIQRLARSHSPDAVLSYWVHPDGEAAIRAARSAGVPAVVMVGGSDVLVLTSDRSRRRSIQNVLRAANAVVTVDRDLEGKVRELGVPSEKIHVVHRGVDPARFNPGDRAEARRRLGVPVEDRALVWVGRMVEVKGLDVMLEACALLRARGIGFRLYLVGDGPLRSSLEARSRAQGLSKAISFVGCRPHDQLADWYRAADLTVLPSRSEGIPNVLRESLACGTPFVASRVGGIPEIADDPANRLVPPGNPTALAEAIDLALRAGGAAVRSQSESLEAAAETLTRIIRSLISEASDGSHAFAEIGRA
jgi:glycosyltransferase involved in cell wall biosynthesis